MTEIALPAVPKFLLHRPSRPMMSRDADSMYWMSRYIERAEHVARLLRVNTNLLVDVGDLAPKLQGQHWESVLTIMRTDAPPPGDAPIGGRIAQFMVFNRDNPNSLVSCLTRARENARAIRENISAEMWEALNTLYWAIRSDEAPARYDESPDDFYRTVMTGSFLFQGLTDQTLAHDQRWLFTQLGKYLERIDVTCRVIDAKFTILHGAESGLDGAVRNIHWMAVLRSCCSIEAYRRRHIADIDPLRVASFLILERNFPRSIRYAVGLAHQAIAAIRAEVKPAAIDAAERVLGRLSAQLEYAEPEEIFADGISPYLDRIQTQIAETALAVQKAYFFH